jgi:2-polyprenyl-6-hydroxyphenyl methylase/3-demethylubiquinone-9 3-methyltransferase
VESLAQYRHGQAAAHSDAYLLPQVLRIIESRRGVARIFEVGCGNGSAAAFLSSHGYAVTGIDASEEGVRIAKRNAAGSTFDVSSAYGDLAGQYGTFPVVLSLEVVEHCFWPRKFARSVFDLVEPGGVAIISTPFHGYWKNLALAVSGRLDAHFTALWDGGHVKFWSERTLRTLLLEAGFGEVSFARVGRIPALAKSMIAIAAKSPAS